MLKKILPVIGLLLFGSFAGYASEGQPVDTQPVKATLVSEETSVQPGKPFWVGVELKMDQGWDTYWMNPGDVGFPTQVKWDLPEGFTAGPIHWPYPEKFTNDALVAFGYTDSVLLMTEITPPKSLPADDPITITADVNWLACKDACVPGNADLSLSLPISDATPQINPETATLFTAARETLPQKDSGEISVQAKKDEIVLNFVPKPGMFGAIEEVQFIPEEGQVIDYAAPQNHQQTKGEITLNVKRADPNSEIPTEMKGVLLVSEKGRAIKRAIQIQTKINPKQAPPATVSSSGVSGVAMALGLAFLGGLILNVMPCVMPVIALKIFGFVKMAGEKRRVIFQHGLIFSFGVILSFWLLSGALLILRAYGEGIGWGFQLQEPVFVAILVAILFMLGLSLFGVFELGTSMVALGSKTSSSSSPMMSSFLSGVLATLVATPCTGPLLGPALGYAMTLPSMQALLIFTGMGLGMASPYLLFSAFPGLVRYLPKPGNWMVTFKHLMGFLMMATVIWLVWVFGAQTDNMATFVLLASLLLLAIGGWIYGRWGVPTQKKATRVIATIIALFMVITGGYTSIRTAKHYRDLWIPVKGRSVSHVADQTQGWEAYSPERVKELQAQGIPVFVDFTAKWCLICQANKVTLHSQAVEEAFEKKGVVTMVGDWTRKDPVITQELEKLGRSGVPVYVLYPGDPTQKPYILPQTLTANIVRDYLDKLDTPTTVVHVD